MLVHIIAIFLGVIGLATLWQFVKLARWPFQLAVIIALVLVLVSLQGCAPSTSSGSPWNWHQKTAAILFGLMLAECFFWYLAKRSIPSLTYLGIAAVVLALLLLTGCAMLPIPLQPKNEQYNSDMAEGAWLVLDGIDTAQTMHLKRERNPTTVVRCNREADPLAAKVYGTQYPSPSRVLLTNIALATVHTMVTSWLDDEVAKHDQANDGSVGPWYVGRIAWHTVSIAFSLHAVINNHNQGCAL